MKFSKETFITGFALFSLFFGAGNLLLPPLLGYQAGSNWFLVTIGFVITAVIIPIIGIAAHAKLQGTMFDFAKKVSPVFSFVYCIIIYVISIALPSPRTASATHEIAIYPLFGSSSLLTSIVYFILVFLFVLNRGRILNVLGKLLTPLIGVILLLVIIIGLYSSPLDLVGSELNNVFSKGLLEGYQTFDAIGAVVVGGVIIISLNLKGEKSFVEKKSLIIKSGLLAGIGLFIIYAGLIAVGAYYGSEIIIEEGLSSDMQRATLLREISASALGGKGALFLSVLVALACFTTAVGIVAGTADYFKGLFKDSQRAYVITSFIGCAVGILIGQLDFHSIIVIALPVLMFIYPITIVLIFLNVLPDKFVSKTVFRAVVLVTFIFSIPDFLRFLVSSESLDSIIKIIPLAQHHLGWLIPSILTFIAANFKLAFNPIKPN